MIDDKKIQAAAKETFANVRNFKDNVCMKVGFLSGVNWFKEAIWHDASEEPESDKCILIRFVDYKGNVEYGTDILAPPITWNNWVEICKIAKWCYVEDLLPKGGDK